MEHVIVIEAESAENEEILLGAEDVGYYEMFRNNMQAMGEEGETYTLYSVENGKRTKIESYRHGE